MDVSDGKIRFWGTVAKEKLQHYYCKTKKDLDDMALRKKRA